MTPRNISRRTFIQTTAGTLAGLAASSRFGTAQAGRPADLVVIGGGLAGLAAAITAADAGASVIVIDKRYRFGGSAMGAGGSFSAAGSRLQRARNIEDSPAKHFEDAVRIGKGKADPALLRLYTEQAAPTQEWLESLGVEFDPAGPRFAFEHELYKTARTCDAKGGGPGFITVLGRHFNERVAAGRITFHGETAARRLVMQGGGTTGVIVTDEDGRDRTLRGRAVLLACGGYGSNRAMLRKYNPTLANALTVTSKYATGDGIRIAEAAGAALVNMNLLAPYFAGVENPPGSGRTLMTSLVSNLVTSFKGDVWVSRLGTRFMNEDSKSPDERERALRAIPDAAVFAVFDDAMLKSNKPPLLGFDAFLEEGRVIKKADTIEGIARQIGVPPTTFAKTMATYNGYVDAGRDDDFGRSELVRIQQPPFYAIIASGVVFMTTGGVKTNGLLQVIGAGGRVIPGLYAAGEVQGAGQWMGDGLMSGAGNGAALVFGRLAAKQALKDRGEERGNR